MKFLNRMKVATRLYLLFGALTSLIIASLLLSYLQQARSEDVLRSLVGQDYRNTQQVSEYKSLTQANNVRIIAVLRNPASEVGVMLAPAMQKGLEDAIKLQDEIRKWATAPEERAWFARSDKLTEETMATLKDLGKLRAENRNEDANALYDKVFVPQARQFHEMTDELMQIEISKLQRHIEELQMTSHQQWWLATVCMAIAILAVVGSGMLLVRRVGRSLADATRTAEAVAGGDLTVHIPVDGEDEFAKLAQAMAHMTSSLNAVVTNVRQGSGEIVGASQQIAQGNQDLSERTERQASHLQQTAATMEELSSMVSSAADNAKRADQFARAASAVADNGAKAVKQVVETMGKIDQSSRKIEEIIGVIDGISFQTNILALNAAVEAARAGEQGRGFAVVAAEVRTLAQRSAGAAKEIKSLITSSAETVAAGAAQVQAAGLTMDDLLKSVAQVSALIEDVNGAASEQHAGIAGVTESVTQLDHATQQNAALVEEAAAAAASMRDEAVRLSAAVSVFKVASVV